jgi:hypothetical protein
VQLGDILTDPHHIAIFPVELLELDVLLVTLQCQAREVEVGEASQEGPGKAVQTVKGRSIYEHANVDTKEGGRNKG